MTREEAIQVLKEYRTIVMYHLEAETPAFDMAIEALTEPNCGSCKHYEPKYDVCHAPELVKQVTSKLKNPCDSLLTEESNGSKEHKSKLESADTNQTNSRLIGANALMDLLKARKRFFIDAYGGFHYMSEKDKARCDEIDACIASIVNAPTASADAVQGEWKHTITWQPYCSNCEYVFGEDEEFSPFWKYCPMCGARMKGGDSE